MLKYTSILLGLAALTVAQQQQWAQCGGIGWTGGTTCVSGSACTKLNDYYYQCIPGATASTPPPTSPTSPTVTLPSSSPTSSPSSGLPRLGGVNTAGYDFSVGTDGSFKPPYSTPPSSQYTHFTAEGVNLYRIPFAWQLMTPTLGGSIDNSFFSTYDATVQAALNSGPKVYVIIDLHNYARWNGQVIAQGGPTNAQYASIWTQLAQKYGKQQRIIFGIMNEPHDVPSVSTWVDTVQQTVNAIRQAGSQNYLLLPGSSWASAQAFPTEAGPLLVKVTDPLGGTSKLIFDVHKYLDSDNSGTHAECTTDNVSVLQTLVSFLKQNGNRQAILSETGGGNTASCEQLLGNELAYVKSAYPTLAGFAVWSAGAFNTNYVLSVVPNGDQDQPLWVQAVKPNLPS
ncbi:endoglucanase [Trametopsis cervina]|nr:endoglucanase [Trametopsis cervina]